MMLHENFHKTNFILHQEKKHVSLKLCEICIFLCDF